MVAIAEKDLVNHGGMGMSVIVVVVAHHRRQKSMGDDHSGGVCRSTIDAGGQGNLLESK